MKLIPRLPRRAVRFSLAGLFLSAVLCLTPSHAQVINTDAPPLLVDTSWGEDFETGTISGWCSYPAFEDTAYDYTIIPGKYHPPDTLQGYLGNGEFYYPIGLHPPGAEQGGDNTYYLLRSYKPNSTLPQRIGMMYKTALYAGQGSSLKFDYWMNDSPSPARIEVHLGGGDGLRYVHTVETAETETWRHLAIPLADFTHEGRPLKPGTGIQALAVIACFERGVTNMMQYFAIDNVRFVGQRRSSFGFAEPAAQAFKHWQLAFSRRMFHAGDALNITVTPDAEAELEAVHARLEDLDGNRVADSLALTRTAQGWSGRDLFHFTQQHRPGPYTLHVEGVDREGRVAASAARLWLVKPRATAGHPRLFVDHDGLEALRQAIRSEPGATLWAGIKARAVSYRNVPVLENPPMELWHKDYILPDFPAFNTWYAILRDPPYGAMFNAWVYALEGDAEAGAWVRETLLTMATWDQWIHPWFTSQGRQSYYPIGMAAMHLGVAYDLVHDLLSEQDRAIIREGLLRNGIRITWEEYFLHNRLPENTSNWISHAAGGAMIALAALDDESPKAGAREESEANLMMITLAEKCFELARYTMRADGGYGEEYGYQDFTMHTAQLQLAALQHAYGIEGLAQSLNYHRAHLYPIYTAIGDAREFLAMGDSYDEIIPTSHWVWFAREAADPLMQWFHNLAPGNGIEDLLWRDNSRPAASPQDLDLPPSRAFPHKGNVVFRTGWGPDATVMVYRAGPNYNHTHNDMGSFRLAALGENLIQEAGPSNYYFDPYYWSYFVQAGGHNVILLDGQSESQEVGDFDSEVKAFDRHARIDGTLLRGPLQFLSSELGMLYRDKLEQWTRKIYFIDPGYFVVYDQLRSADGPHRFQSQLFPPRKKNLEVTGPGSARIRSGQAGLQVDVLLPRQPELVVLDRPVPVNQLTNFLKEPAEARAVLQVTHGAPQLHQEFMMVLTPGRADSASTATHRLIQGEGYSGVEVRQGERVDQLLFASNGTIAGDVTTDGASAALRLTGDLLAAATFERATHAEFKGRPLLRADRPVHASLVASGAQRTWHFNADQPAEVQVFAEDGTAATLQIPAGESTF